MPFIEDDNGLAIYFTRDQWQTMLDCLNYTYENYFTYENTVGTQGKKMVEIALKIKKHVEE
jgi:hypothetical protein